MTAEITGGKEETDNNTENQIDDKNDNISKKRESGMDFYKDVLGSPKYVVAPMVDASELAWRELGRRYGADLCYSPMFHSKVFVQDARYRRDSLQTCAGDRPLIIQFCANDPQLFLEAAKLTVEAIECEAIDINLGCPQIIAKRGHFGSFLQDEWELIHKIISTASRELDIPITAKCRVFPEIEKTVEYARMLEKAGAQMITVHGRTRDQKGPLTGLASWTHIRAVKEAVSVPVLANGNIQNKSDADRCILETGVEGVMSAEGHLTNPALFAGLNPPVWEMCLEYLDLVKEYPCPTSYVRGHLFKLLNHCFQVPGNHDLREIIAKSSQVTDFREAVLKVKERYIAFHTGEKSYKEVEELKIFNLKFPPWICQPYVRPPPEVYVAKMKQIKESKEQETKRGRPEDEQGSIEDLTTEKREDGEVSKRKKKKMERNPYKPFSKARANCALCSTCGNPSGLKCLHELCRTCCKNKAFKENLDCAGHKVFVKTNREKAKLRPGYKEKETFNKTETLENKTETMETVNDTGIKPEAAAISTMTTAAGFLEIKTNSAQLSTVEPNRTSELECIGLDSDKNTLNDNIGNS